MSFLKEGEYPTTVDTPNLKERRVLWTARILAFGFTLSMIFNISMVWTISSLVPLKEIRPFVVQLSDSKTVFSTITPLADIEKMNGSVFLTENLAKEYIKYRHEILRSDKIMMDRWAEGGFVQRMSTKTEYDRFRNNAIDIFEKLRKEDITQEVAIENTQSLRENSVIQITFSTITRAKDSRVLDETKWIATMEVSYQEQEKIPYEQRHVNPTGFTVLNYTLTKKVS